MFCKANAQRQAPVLLLSGIKSSHAFLSKMCKCVNYVKNRLPVQVEEVENMVYSLGEGAGVQGCRGVAYRLMLKTASQHFIRRGVL